MFKSLSIAYVISAHGYGHAARSMAVMQAIWRRRPEINFHVFSKVPAWFFVPHPPDRLVYHDWDTDPGMVQRDPLQADLAATMQRWAAFYPLDGSKTELLASAFLEHACGLVLCDIAPLGLVAAQDAGLPGVLIENFTWEWIFEILSKQNRAMGKFADLVRGYFDQAQARIQTRPCVDHPAADLRTAPVSRRIRQSEQEVRARIGVPDGEPLVLLTMGGIAGYVAAGLEPPDGIWVAIAGGRKPMETHPRVRHLPRDSALDHPSLVAASRAVVGKAGYSTLAEVYQAGVPFGYFSRPDFPESAVLETFLQDQIPGRRLQAGDLERRFKQTVAALLEYPQLEGRRENGDEALAGWILAQIGQDQIEVSRSSCC